MMTMTERPVRAYRSIIVIDYNPYRYMNMTGLGIFRKRPTINVDIMTRGR